MDTLHSRVIFDFLIWNGKRKNEIQPSSTRRRLDYNRDGKIWQADSVGNRKFTGFFFYHDIARWFIVVHERLDLGLGERKNYGFFYIFCRSSATCNIIIIRRRCRGQLQRNDD